MFSSESVPFKFYWNYIEICYEETSQYTKSLRKKIEDIDKKIRKILWERMENENVINDQKIDFK